MPRPLSTSLSCHLPLAAACKRQANCLEGSVNPCWACRHRNNQQTPTHLFVQTESTMAPSANNDAADHSSDNGLAALSLREIGSSPKYRAHDHVTW